MMMSWILDGATVAVVVIFLFLGMKSGFIKSVVRLIGFAVAVVAAALISTPVANAVYDTFLASPVRQAVSDQVGKGVAAAATTVNEQIAQVTQSLPTLLQNLLTAYDGRIDPVDPSAVSADELTELVVTQFLQPVCVALLQVLVFLILFVVLFLAIRLLGGVLDKLFAALPVLKQANGLLGAVIGLAEGLLMVTVLCCVLELYMTMAGADSVITAQDLAGTTLLKVFMDINPIF